jgi:hypothetical protein
MSRRRDIVAKWQHSCKTGPEQGSSAYGAAHSVTESDLAGQGHSTVWPQYGGAARRQICLLLKYPKSKTPRDSYFYMQLQCCNSLTAYPFAFIITYVNGSFQNLR